MIRFSDTEAKQIAPVPALTGEVLPPFDYSSLSQEAAELARSAKAYIGLRQRNVATSILEIGQKLLEVKAALDHGQFGGWLAAEFGWTDRTARTYMSDAAALGDKSETVSVLPISILHQLARAPEPVREGVVAEMRHTTMTAQQVRDRVTNWVADIKNSDRERKKTPEEKRREKKRRAAEEREQRRHAAEWAEKQRLREKANSAVALSIVETFGDRLVELRIALMGSDFDALLSWLDMPYGWDFVGLNRVPRPAQGERSLTGGPSGGGMDSGG